LLRDLLENRLLAPALRSVWTKILLLACCYQEVSRSPGGLAMGRKPLAG